MIMDTKKKPPQGFQEAVAGLPRKAALEEARRCLQCHNPACREACPLGVDIPGFIRSLREGNARDALARIRRENDLPGVCGRICPAPCEQACVLRDKGQAIAVRALERFASDQGRGLAVFKKKTANQGPRVALVGSGPSGLAAAGTLAKQGCQVRVLEVLPYLGGRLRFAVARFRLPEAVLQQETIALRQEGVDFETSFWVGSGCGAGELLARGFQAVVLAVGSGRPQDWPVPGQQLGGVFYPEELMFQSNITNSGDFKAAFRFLTGSKVVVLGHGSTALDCARMCARLGKEATMVFDHPLEELNVYPQDREWAGLEGVRFETLIRPVKILGDERSRVCGVLCRRMDYADPSSKGEWRLTEVPESDFVLPADAVITAAGREPQAALFLSHPQLKKDKDRTISTDACGRTSMKGVYACGDLTLGLSDPVRAMASGKKTAENICDDLRGSET